MNRFTSRPYLAIALRLARGYAAAPSILARAPTRPSLPARPPFVNLSKLVIYIYFYIYIFTKI